jgi:hypothetical protein
VFLLEDAVAHTYHELKGKTIQELRDIAKDVENQDAVQGYSQMNKDHLLPALCKALGIETHAHHAAALDQKLAMKMKMREIKQQRAHALATHDHHLLEELRHQYHRLNHSLRRSAKLTHH